MNYIANIFFLIRYDLYILILYLYSFFHYIFLVEVNKEEVMAVAFIDLSGEADEIREI